MAICLGNSHPQVKLGGFGHFPEFDLLLRIEVGHPVRIVDNALNGQITLGHIDQPANLVSVSDQEQEVILVGSVFLQTPLVLEQFHYKVGWWDGLDSWYRRRVVMDDH